MIMNSDKNIHIEQEAGELIDHIKDYVETQGELTRLNVLDKGSKASGAAVGGFILGVLALLFFIFMGIAFAFLINEFTGHDYIGFFVIAGVYLVTGILLAVNREKWIHGPIADKIIRNYFEEHESKED